MKLNGSPNLNLDRGPAATAASKAGGDALSLFMNVSSSVLIVFVNKSLMDPKWGFGFVFGEPACSHFNQTRGIGMPLYATCTLHRPRSDNIVLVPFFRIGCGSEGLRIRWAEPANGNAVARWV